MQRLVLCALLAAACGDDAQQPTFQTTCQASEPSAEAKLLVGVHPSQPGAKILIDGRLLTPSGTQIPLGGFPLNMRFVGGGTRFVALSDGAKGVESIRVVDLMARRVVAEEPYANQHGLFYGLAVSAAGTRLYASGGGENVVHVLDVNPQTGALTPRPDIAVPNYPAGLALSGNTLYAAEQTSAKLAVIDLVQGRVTSEIQTGGGASDVPFDVGIVQGPGSSQLIVMTLTGASALMVTNTSGTSTTRVPVGKNPEALLVVGTRVLVASADDDSLTVVDPFGRSVVSTIPLALEAQQKGASPAALAVSPDGARVYVGLAAENSLVALSAADLMPIGRVPTAWYPQAVAVAQDGTVIVANAKGESIGPADGTIEKSDLIRGTLSLLSPPPDDAAMQAGTMVVMQNSVRPSALTPQPTCQPGQPARFALPMKPGDPTPIEHVILIVRENKTYDAELGSLAGANGDASLEIFGPRMTPNLHALAQKFTNLDNFYIAAEASLQGHVLTTASFVGDFGEKAWLQTWGRGWRDEITYSENIVVPSGFIWQKLQAESVSYVDMGELVGTTESAQRVNVDTKYPGISFTLDVADADRAAYFTSLLARGDYMLPKFTYMILPRNHTAGLRPGVETPESMIADNDEATGMIVEALSRSRFWASSVVFVVEDDPQDGGDHVDGHRSICLVVSPWVRHGYTSSGHYDVGSLFHTIEALLGIGPMYQTDGRASLMADLWAQTPDRSPWAHIPRMIPVTTNSATSGPLVEASRRLDLSAPDRSPELSRILWRYFKGSEPPWRQAAPEPDDE
ncbi:MAG TPA: bifunctional YncE family protein/alkaline phosphatase family protein [Polyangia bacterium]|nr:bifunctional YncE family protein/alkaline phosphatase family protein [Polyangia bacterium]